MSVSRWPPLGDQPVEAWLEDDRDERDGDEGRDDRLERLGGEDEQQHGAGDAAEH
jgi:hypothetical protein